MVVKVSVVMICPVNVFRRLVVEIRTRSLIEIRVRDAARCNQDSSLGIRLPLFGLVRDSLKVHDLASVILSSSPFPLSSFSSPSCRAPKGRSDSF